MSCGLQEAVLAGDRREEDRRTDDKQPQAHLRKERAAGGDEGECRGQHHDDSVEWEAVDVHLASHTLVFLCLEGAPGSGHHCQHEGGQSDDPVEVRVDQCGLHVVALLQADSDKPTRMPCGRGCPLSRPST